RSLIAKELRKLRECKLGVMQLYQAKQKFKGQIALAEENRLSLIISLSKSLLDDGRVQTLEELFVQIDAVGASQLLGIANDILDERQLSALRFIPELAPYPWQFPCFPRYLPLTACIDGTDKTKRRNDESIYFSWSGSPVCGHG